MSNNKGTFVPTTSVWDVGPLLDVDVTSPQFKELLVRMYQNLNLMANVLNVKDTGYYTTLETECGQQYFPNPNNSSQTSKYRAGAFRSVYRIYIPIGTLPNNSTVSVPHGLNPTSSWMATRIFGAASDPINREYIPLPYSSASSVSDNIEINFDDTNVNVTTGSNRSNFTVSGVVLEYLQY